MLKRIELAGVGPADTMNAELAPGINVITGDNGLGKSLLLDVAWWTLTRTWVGTPAIPRRNTKVATLRYVLHGGAKDEPAARSTFDFDTQTWSVDKMRPATNAIVIYARADGGFSVWDPARNAFHFDASEVWEGLDIGGSNVCEGLERDWRRWQRAQAPELEWMKKALVSLSPPDDPLRPRWSGEDVPLVGASAGTRRVLAIAYLLVWAWREHTAEVARRQLGGPERRLVFLVDEPEMHLHPRWQRVLVPAIRHAADALRGEGSETQIVTATHSPMVMASLETVFDIEHDAWLALDLVGEGDKRHVELRSRRFIRRGEASAWLRALGLLHARSLEAEIAIQAAEVLLEAPSHSKEDIKRVDAELRASLTDIDGFWRRWREFVGEGAWA